MSFSINNFDNVPSTIIMSSNKHALLETSNYSENFLNYLRVTAQNYQVTTPGVMFTGITGLTPNKQYYITITGWNNSPDRKPFIYVATVNQKPLTTQRIYLNNEATRTTYYWETAFTSFVAPANGEVVVGVLIENAVNTANFDLHSIELSEKIPNKTYHIRPEYEPLMLVSNDTSSCITSYFTASDTADTPSRVYLPEFAPDGTNFTFTFAEGGLIQNKTSSIVVNTGDSTGNISGTLTTANYNDPFDEVDDKIVMDSMILSFVNVEYLQFTGTQGDTVVFTKLNDKWIVNGSVFLIDHSSLIETS